MGIPVSAEQMIHDLRHDFEKLRKELEQLREGVEKLIKRLKDMP